MTALAPPTDVTTTELLRWLFDRLNAHDAPSMRQCWTQDVTEYFPDAACHGPDEVAAYFEAKFAAIEGFRLEVLAITESGDDALVHWRMTGRHVGPLVGVAGTGKPLEIEGMDHFVVRDGKVVTNTVVFDQMDFARQIGLLPADGSVADKALKAAFNTRTRAVSAARRRSRHQPTAGSA